MPSLRVVTTSPITGFPQVGSLGLQSVCSLFLSYCLNDQVQMLTVRSGVVVLVLIILSMLIFACRRRRHIRASKVMVSNYSGGGGQPQAYSSWQRAQQPSYGPHAPEPGWYHPAPGTAPFDRAKTTEAQRTAASEQMPRTAAFGEGQSVPPSNQVQRPAPSVQAQITAFPGQAQRIAPSGQVQSAASPGQASLPSGQAQSAASSAQAQEQGAPPRYARTKDTNGREQNPPPYSPVSRPFFGACFTAHALTPACFEARWTFDSLSCTYRALGQQHVVSETCELHFFP